MEDEVKKYEYVDQSADFKGQGKVKEKQLVKSDMSTRPEEKQNKKENPASPKKSDPSETSHVGLYNVSKEPPLQKHRQFLIIKRNHSTEEEEACHHHADLELSKLPELQQYIPPNPECKRYLAHKHKHQQQQQDNASSNQKLEHLKNHCRQKLQTHIADLCHQANLDSHPVLKLCEASSLQDRRVLVRQYVSMLNHTSPMTSSASAPLTVAPYIDEKASLVSPSIRRPSRTLNSRTGLHDNTMPSLTISNLSQPATHNASHTGSVRRSSTKVNLVSEQPDVSRRSWPLVVSSIEKPASIRGEMYSLASGCRRKMQQAMHCLHDEPAILYRKGSQQISPPGDHGSTNTYPGSRSNVVQDMNELSSEVCLAPRKTKSRGPKTVGRKKKQKPCHNSTVTNRGKKQKQDGDQDFFLPSIVAPRTTLYKR